MTTRYKVTLIKLSFLTVNDSEWKTSIHFSEFSGHEKHYQFLLANISYRVIWRHGIDLIYHAQLDKPPLLEAAEKVSLIKVYCNERLIEFGTPNRAWQSFCEQLDHLPPQTETEIAVPGKVEALLHLTRVKAQR